LIDEPRKNGVFPEYRVEFDDEPLIEPAQEGQLNF
jgi:hypothetical protein